MASTTPTTSVDRADVTFRSGADDCAAWLYLPDGPGPHATIVLGHGLGAVREMRLDAYAERFVAAGYACLVFDYRHFGASGGEPRQLLDIGKQLDDWAAAIAYARSRSELDPERVVAWGSSFGGGHGIVVSARDPRLAATIVQCPFTDGVASGLVMNPIAATKVMALAARDEAAARRGRAPVYVDTVGPKGSAALMTASDAAPGYLGLVPGDPGESTTFRNEVAARLALRLIAHRPGRLAAKVQGPILFCVCDGDSVAPAKATLRHAAKAPRGEIRRYDDGHFAIYTGEGFERVVSDQLEFLGRHVPVAARS